MRWLWLVMVGCTSSPEAPDRDDPTTPTDSDPVATDSDPIANEVLDDGLALLPRLAGLWSGPASQTPLGAFPLMNVDVRAMGDGLLWGRVDLDTENALRFGFAVETRAPDQVVYRNGGFFLGLLRDDRTALHSYDAAEERWRFCDVVQGCGYIDAVYDFEGDTRLIFDVKVREAPHVLWDAQRLEARPLPPGFPETLQAPDADLPPMPTLRVQVAWSTPLAEDADVWLVLTVENCLPSGCAVSRSTRALATKGSTMAELILPEIHGGAYKANTILDRGRDLALTFVPGLEDGVSLPNMPLDVRETGLTDASMPIVVNP